MDVPKILTMPTQTASTVDLAKRLVELGEQRATVLAQKASIDAEIQHTMELFGGSNGHTNGHTVMTPATETQSAPAKATRKPRTPKAEKTTETKDRIPWEPSQPAVVENGVSIYTAEGPKRKVCANPQCKKIVGIRTSVCVCGWSFREKKLVTPPEPVKPDAERAEALKLPCAKIIKAAKKPLTLPDATGRLLHMGVTVKDGSDVELALKALVKEGVAVHDEKERTWFKVVV